MADAGTDEDRLDPITRSTIARVKDAAYAVHRELGAGFRENVYQRCLAHLLADARIPFVERPRLTIQFRGLRIGNAGEPDFIVHDRVVVELKVAQAKHPVHGAQVVNYLKATGHPAGILINFNVALMKHGFDYYLHPKLFRRQGLRETLEE